MSLPTLQAEEEIENKEAEEHENHMNNKVNINFCDSFIKVCQLEENNDYFGSQKLYKVKFEKTITMEQLKSTIGRVYMIVVDDIIYKIGYTDDQQGIINLAGYGVGNGGGPSNRTCGIHYLIAEKLFLREKVEFYVKWAEVIQNVTIGGLTKKYSESRDISSGRISEEVILNEYKKLTNNQVPIWNKQESGRKNDWSLTIKTIRSSICDKKYITKKEAEKLDEKNLMELYYKKWTCDHTGKMISVKEKKHPLYKYTKGELIEMCKKNNVDLNYKLKKDDLVKKMEENNIKC
jgi:hypothetical protein